ncbi:hypothetical protein [Halalkalibacter oceani]|uniref:hypothetical protein n=1 Tax=Halalkalibacter oceani TaxID=1653776 RepID=UPI0033928159
MKKESNFVILEYKTLKAYCHCCNQKLPNVKTSDLKQFKFTANVVLEWTEWKEVIEFEEDFDECVREYVYVTIGFFATNPDDKILIKDSEFDKVKQLILSVVK